MDNKLKSITLENINIPMNGWVLWQGESQRIENSYHKILRLSPSEALTVNSKLVSMNELHVGLNIAAIFEWGGLLSNRSLLDNLLLPFEYHSRETSVVREKILSNFSSLGYEQYLQDRPFCVPRNVQKLTAVLRAFLQEPDCIFVFNLSFGLEDRDKEFLKKFMQDYRHINVHFSDCSLHKVDDFTEVVDVEKWGKAA